MTSEVFFGCLGILLAAVALTAFIGYRRAGIMGVILALAFGVFIGPWLASRIDRRDSEFGE